MLTYSEISTNHSVTLPPHLEAQMQIPVSAGLQRQGDLIILPIRPGKADFKPVPAEGVAVIRGENGGNTHLLVADGDVQWAEVTNRTQDIGTISVAEGATAYLLHPEHGAQGFAPGQYIVRRQREQADEIQLVAD